MNERKEAFVRFLAMARDPAAYAVSITDRSGRSRPIEASGAILVWGSVTEEGRRAVMEEFGFADVLSVEAIIRDLLKTENQAYLAFVAERERWCAELFRAMQAP